MNDKEKLTDVIKHVPISVIYDTGNAEDIAQAIIDDGWIKPEPIKDLEGEIEFLASEAVVPITGQPSNQYELDRMEIMRRYIRLSFEKVIAAEKKKWIEGMNFIIDTEQAIENLKSANLPASFSHRQAYFTGQKAQLEQDRSK